MGRCTSIEWTNEAVSLMGGAGMGLCVCSFRRRLYGFTLLFERISQPCVCLCVIWIKGQCITKLNNCIVRLAACQQRLAGVGCDLGTLQIHIIAHQFRAGLALFSSLGGLILLDQNGRQNQMGVG